MPRTSQVLEAVTAGERAVKDELHRLVIAQEVITVKALAEASGYTASSSYKALDRDAVNGLSFRILDAAALLSPEIAAALVRLLTGRWTTQAQASGAESVPRALQVIGRAAETQKWIAAALDDGKIDETEWEQIERTLDLLDLSSKKLRASRDASRLPRIGGVA